MASPKLHDPAPGFSSETDFLSFHEEPTFPEEILIANQALEHIRQASLRDHNRQLWKLRLKDALLLGLMALVITWPLTTLLFAGVR
jgi:hypothetical protein